MALLWAIVIWGLTDVRWRARIDPENPTVHKTDFTVYTEAGAAFFDGRDPYLVTNPRGWHYLYPPLFAILVAPLAAFDSQIQAIIWYFLSVAACFGVWYECRRLWRYLHADCHCDTGGLEDKSVWEPQSPPLLRLQGGGESTVASPPGWLGWLAVATVALPTLNCLQRGQVGIVLVYLLVLGLRLVLQSRRMRGVIAGGIVLALAATIKLTPLLPAGLLGMVMLVSAWRMRHTYANTIADRLGRGPWARGIALAAGQTAGLLLFVIVIPGLIVGHENNVSHLQTWMARVAANDDVGRDNDFNVYSKRNQSFANAVRRLGNRAMFAAGLGADDRSIDVPSSEPTVMPMDAPAVDRLLRLFAVGVVGLLLVAGWRVAGRGDAAGVAAVFGLACMATLVVSPLSWGHHYVLWLPGLLFVPQWLWHNNRRAQAIGMAEAACVLVAAHYVLLDHAGRVGLLGIGAAVWYIAGTVSVGWPRKTSSQERARLIADHREPAHYRRAA